MADLSKYQPVPGTVNANHPTVTQFAGFSIRESAVTAAAAAANIRVGSGSGTILMHLELAANQSDMILFPQGIFVTPEGVYVEQVSGTISFTLYNLA